MHLTHQVRWYEDLGYHHDAPVQIAATRQAKRDFKRACRDSQHKTTTQKAYQAPEIQNATDNDGSFELSIRTRAVCSEKDLR